ncbi:hypothetical protein [Nocardia cyriacigeorgica]|uniref:hypothetical protein n=1 Tax=Nocardia cyriacigeorgica TaxID=135487 RepID=UPI001E64A14E|nr:hypothetical protein [Nocardia cyriacigeorgica]
MLSIFGAVKLSGTVSNGVSNVPIPGTTSGCAVAEPVAGSSATAAADPSASSITRRNRREYRTSSSDDAMMRSSDAHIEADGGRALFTTAFELIRKTSR